MSNTSVQMSEGTSKRTSPKICGICDQNPSKYCCPRCAVYYCSLNCYKSEKHQNCSESFYQECVKEELAGNEMDKESQQKMVEILKRMKEQDVEDPEQIEEVLGNLESGLDDEDFIDSDDENFVDLQDRLNGLNLDDADSVWNALTEDERNEFEALLNQGDVGSFIPRWEPWWGYVKKEKMVEDVSDGQEIIEEDHYKNCPKLVEVPKFATLTSVQPSPAIKFNITNVLASYAFTLRYFNGELEPVEGSVYLLNVCSNLDSNTNFEDPAIAVESVVQNCLKSELIQTDEISLDVMKHDTFLIIKGPNKENKSFYCRTALSHLHAIFNEAKTAGKYMKTVEKAVKPKNGFSKKFPEHTKEHLPKLDVSKIKKCIKKVEFYLAFVESYGMEYE